MTSLKNLLVLSFVILAVACSHAPFRSVKSKKVTKAHSTEETIQVERAPASVVEPQWEQRDILPGTKAAVLQDIMWPAGSNLTYLTQLAESRGGDYLRSRIACYLVYLPFMDDGVLVFPAETELIFGEKIDVAGSAFEEDFPKNISTAYIVKAPAYENLLLAISCRGQDATAGYFQKAVKKFIDIDLNPAFEAENLK